mgnify:CR=1 FL=1
MNNYERLEGMVAATFTPLDENGDVNLSVIDKYADWIASTPVKGVFVCGTTGEFSSLTIGERKAVLEKWVASAAKRDCTCRFKLSTRRNGTGKPRGTNWS